MLAAAALSACSAPESDGRQSAPFTVAMGSINLEVPERDDLYQARLIVGSGTTVKIRICERAHAAGSYEPTIMGCDGLEGPRVNRHGVSTLISHEQGAVYDLLKERPLLKPPTGEAMAPIPAEQIDRDLLGNGEAGQLSRVSRLGRPLQTTDRGWPVAACGPSLLDKITHQCGVGFLVEDVFVEAQWTAEPAATLTQADVWAVATALDAKIRSLRTPPRTEVSSGATSQGSTKPPI